MNDGPAASGDELADSAKAASRPGAEVVALGKVVAPYGVQGWLKLRPFADDPQAWSRVDPLLGRPDRSGLVGTAASDETWRSFAIESLRVHGGAVLLKLMGFTSRTQAETLQGWLFGAARECLPKTAEDEYYWADLIGLAVVNRDGALLGRVRGLIETGANDVLQVVDAAGTERLLPFVAAVVGRVDVAGGTVEVDWGSDW